MPSRARSETLATPPRTTGVVGTRPAPVVRGVGKLACTKNFHCVRARDAPVFYRVLVQLN